MLIGSGSKEKTATLPRFLCDIIKNGEFNPTIIKWLNKEDGVFLIVKPKDIAELWGKCKGNPKMKYPSMSRGIRYVKTGIVRHHSNSFACDPVDSYMLFNQTLFDCLVNSLLLLQNISQTKKS